MKHPENYGRIANLYNCLAHTLDYYQSQCEKVFPGETKEDTLHYRDDILILSEKVATAAKYILQEMDEPDRAEDIYNNMWLRWAEEMRKLSYED